MNISKPRARFANYSFIYIYIYIYIYIMSLSLTFISKMPSFKLAMLFIVYLLVTNFSYCYSFDVTVSLDGTGNYVKISDAIAAAPNFSTKRFSIHVKLGTYKELIEVPPSKTFIALIGDDASTTIIVDDRSNGTGSTTATSATLSKLQILR